MGILINPPNQWKTRSIVATNARDKACSKKDTMASTQQKKGPYLQELSDYWLGHRSTPSKSTGGSWTPPLVPGAGEVVARGNQNPVLITEAARRSKKCPECCGTEKK